VTNLPRARKFYEKALGLKLTRKLGPAFVEYDIGSGTLAVACDPKHWPPSRKGTSAALEVADFDAALAHLKKKRVKIAVGPKEFPTCRMVAVRDPDGNLISLHQRKGG
jgi:predicted enzyme related to lactoylglutathione lyase